MVYQFKMKVFNIMKRNCAKYLTCTAILLTLLCSKSNASFPGDDLMKEAEFLVLARQAGAFSLEDFHKNLSRVAEQISDRQKAAEAQKFGGSDHKKADQDLLASAGLSVAMHRAGEIDRETFREELFRLTDNHAEQCKEDGHGAASAAEMIAAIEDAEKRAGKDEFTSDEDDSGSTTQTPTAKASSAVVSNSKPSCKKGKRRGKKHRRKSHRRR